MPAISVRKLAILALLSAPDATGTPAARISGVTRLQKLLFLVDKQLPRISNDRDLRFDIKFEPYRFGPADLHLYQDLEFLIALGHVQRGLRGDAANDAFLSPEESTERALSFGYLMGDEEDASLLAEAEGEAEEYAITATGQETLESILRNAQGRTKRVCLAVTDSAAAVKSRYGSWPMPRLLRYVYSEYPDMTTSSEIRERVLGSQ